VSAIRSAAQVPGNPEVADALAAAISRQQGRERVFARKHEQEETAAACRQEEETVIFGLEVDIGMRRATDPGMSLLDAVEYIAPDPDRRIALYRYCRGDDRNIGPSGMGQDGLLKTTSLVDKDLALLERRAKADGVSGLVKRRDETWISALEWSRKGLATVRSPLPPTQGRKLRKPLWTRLESAQTADPSRLSLKIGFEVPKHLLRPDHQSGLTRPRLWDGLITLATGSQGAWVDNADLPEKTAFEASKLRMTGALHRIRR
jgi:hypothetical protein